MAKYLGGIEDSNIEIVGISQHFFSAGFDIQYCNYQLDTLAVQKLDIAKSLVKVEEVSAEIHSSPKYEKHVVLCELANGWRFAMELDRSEYMAWKEAMDKRK